MKDPHDVFLSIRDAEVLGAMLRAQSRTHPLELSASEALAELLMDARIVALERLPADRVAMGSTVTYVNEPSGVRRTVRLVYPQQADAAQKGISVLSPIGLALIGRRPGSLVMSEMPNGWPFTVRIVDTRPDAESLQKTG